MTSETLKNRIYESILTNVLNGEYTCDAIITEKQLSLKYGVSKAPVREALVELCSRNILRSVPRKGYKVVRYSDRTIKEILEFRVMLEKGCLESSFDIITPTQLKRLETIVQNEFILLNGNDQISYWTRTMDFHLTLASFSENEFVYNQLDIALSTYMRAIMQIYWEECQKFDDWRPSTVHREIVAAIAEKRRADALLLLEKDIRSISAHGI